jgi:hypothetical protein
MSDSWPFAGISCERPYPVSGLNTSRWKTDVPIEPVEFKNLILTQDGVYIAKLFYPVDPLCLDYPHVVAYSGRMWLEDGHHRVTAEAVRGATSMLMRVYRMS